MRDDKPIGVARREADGERQAVTQRTAADLHAGRVACHARHRQAAVKGGRA